MTHDDVMAAAGDLSLAQVGLRLIADEGGTSLEFTSSTGTKVIVRINELGEKMNRHEAETLRQWSADQQAHRKR